MCRQWQPTRRLCDYLRGALIKLTSESQSSSARSRAFWETFIIFASMKKIGIISDTHSLFDESLREFLSDVDEIWHAGDFDNIETADAIAAFKPLIGVHGNIDGGTTRIVYPENQVWTCEGVKVAMTHIGGHPARYDTRGYRLIREHKPNLFIAGHSHILRVQFDSTNRLLYINPGACGVSGFHKVRTTIRLIIDGKDMKNLEVGEWPLRSIRY